VVARGPAAAGVRCPAPGHRLPLPGRRTGTPAPAPPQSWPTGTPSARQPLLNLASLLGLSITTTGDPTPAALAVGRLRRTAWFSGVRAAGNVEAEITLAPDRASLGDLEVDLKEYAADGLVQARRLRLADLALPGGSPERVTVALPTLGPGLKRQLRLYDRAGRLLDTCDAAAFLSQIKISMTGHAGEESTTQHVSVGQAPSALRRNPIHGSHSHGPAAKFIASTREASSAMARRGLPSSPDEPAQCHLQTTAEHLVPVTSE
jgi:hypothetical protein